jgi:hypothetical protein
MAALVGEVLVEAVVAVVAISQPNKAIKWENLQLAFSHFVRYFSQLINFPLLGR